MSSLLTWRRTSSTRGQRWSGMRKNGEKETPVSFSPAVSGWGWSSEKMRFLLEKSVKWKNHTGWPHWIREHHSFHLELRTWSTLCFLFPQQSHLLRAEVDLPRSAPCSCCVPKLWLVVAFHQHLEKHQGWSGRGEGKHG